MKKNRKKSTKKRRPAAEVFAGLISANIILFLIVWAVYATLSPIIEEETERTKISGETQKEEKNMTTLLILDRREEDESAVFVLFRADRKNKKIKILTLPEKTAEGKADLKTAYFSGGGKTAAFFIFDKLDIKPDRYCTLKKEGFSLLTGLLGVIDLNIEREIRVEKSFDAPVSYKAGAGTFDGEQLYDLFLSDFVLEGEGYKSNFISNVFGSFAEENLNSGFLNKRNVFSEKFFEAAESTDISAFDIDGINSFIEALAENTEKKTEIIKISGEEKDDVFILSGEAREYIKRSFAD